MGWRRSVCRFGLALLGLYALALGLLALMPKVPARPGVATIVSIYPNAHGRYRSPTVTVVARSDEGLLGSTSVPASQLHCKTGDTVGVTSTKTSLTLRRADCSSPPSSR